MTPLLLRTVGSRMTPAPMTVTPEDTLHATEIWMELAEARHLPVVRDGKLVGLISLRDILSAQHPWGRFSQVERSAAAKRILAGEIMSKEPITVSPHDELSHAADLMRSHQISCLPVVHRGELVGLLTTNDLIAFALDVMELEAREIGAPLKVARLMTPSPVTTVSRDDHLDVVAILMRHGHFRHLPVVEDDRLFGIVSSRDMVAALRSGLEQLSPAERLAERTKLRAAEIMTPDPIVVGPEANAAEAGRMLVRKRIGALPVVHHGRLIGILTETDFLTYVSVCAPLCTEEPELPATDG